MSKERIRAYYDAGENCAQIILRAAAEEYSISLSEDILMACRGIQGGFGYGGMCSGLVAAVMVLGLLFESEEVKRKRLLFLVKTQEQLGSLDCSRLSASAEDCIFLLEKIAELLKDVIEE